MSLAGNRKIRRAWAAARWGRFHWLWRHHWQRYWPWAGWGPKP